MIIRRWIYVSIAILYTALVWPQDSAKIMFYNLLDFPEAPPANRELILRDIIDEIQPDIFMVAELQDQIGADLVLTQSLNTENTDFASAPFVFNTSGNGGTIQQLLFYNTKKFSLELTDVIQTSLRDINRYQLKAITLQSQNNPILIDFFVAHFKASQGSFNEQIRFDMALAFTNYINANLTADANVVFAGDFNFYSASESGLQQLFIGNTIIPMNDPINQLGDWHTEFGFSAVHTQSTRESNNSFNDFGAGGGLDDRFDFMFVSENILSNTHEVNYIEGSYQAYGNNGNCFNEDISDASCYGEFNQSTRNLLWNMSDHLPVVMNLKFEQNFLNVERFKSENAVSFPYGNIFRNDMRINIHFDYVPRIDYFYIYNTLGQQVKIINAHKSEILVSIEGLPNGIYFLKAQNINAKKFIISR